MPTSSRSPSRLTVPSDGDDGGERGQPDFETVDVEEHSRLLVERHVDEIVLPGEPDDVGEPLKIDRYDTRRGVVGFERGDADVEVVHRDAGRVGGQHPGRFLVDVDARLGEVAPVVETTDIRVTPVTAHSNPEGGPSRLAYSASASPLAIRLGFLLDRRLDIGPVPDGFTNRYWGAAARRTSRAPGGPMSAPSEWLLAGGTSVTAIARRLDWPPIDG